MDRILIIVVSCYWSPVSNIFFFRCGHVGITMMVVCALTSHLNNDDEISPLIDQELTFDVSKAHMSYRSFILVKVNSKDSEVSHRNIMCFFFTGSFVVWCILSQDKWKRNLNVLQVPWPLAGNLFWLLLSYPTHTEIYGRFSTRN